MIRVQVSAEPFVVSARSHKTFLYCSLPCPQMIWSDRLFSITVYLQAYLLFCGQRIWEKPRLIMETFSSLKKNTINHFLHRKICAFIWTVLQQYSWRSNLKVIIWCSWVVPFSGSGGIRTHVIEYNLRNSQTDLDLSKPKREFRKRSFKYSGAYMWNNLPLVAKQAQSIFTFKTCIKQNIRC